MTDDDVAARRRAVRTANANIRRRLMIARCACGAPLDVSDDLFGNITDVRCFNRCAPSETARREQLRIELDDWIANVTGVKR